MPDPAAAHGVLGLTGEIAARQEYSINNTMNLAHCIPKLQQRGILDQAVARRIAKYNEHSQPIRRNVDNVDNVLNTNHEITDGSITMDSTDAEVFATRDDGCVLSIETTEGPFYVEGEFVRWALWDDEFGIPMYLDLQIIDTETCEPAPDVWVEVWHANATGVYSGVVTNANGAGDSDPDNAFKTFHRGLQKTNADGAVWFGTNFPGHYAGRTPHVHIMTHAAGTEALANDTVQNNVATHAGQMFFDQKLVEKMRKHERYGKNKQHFIENKDDAYFRQEAEFTDPVMSYVLLDQENKDIGEGIMAWKLVGVNMTNVRELYVADTFLGQ
ncbi:extracellular dioxygenase [Colletotrichum kahawae]|uniref:Extracellular dioxygenase n=1 Tax=Colletotrichum kahawae TaxID=34407 RepID=A0AAE0CZM1_COLKA|nr:extracellular dioxygenase [Colletotrichum kahawae]